VLWAILLALTLTYLNLPGWCVACLIGHACHLVIWTIWLFEPSISNKYSSSSPREKLCLALFAPVSVVALFSCLNLTFMAYSHKPSLSLADGKQSGDLAPPFIAKTIKGQMISIGNEGLVINFVSPDCLYCHEQQPVLNLLAKQGKLPYRFITVTTKLPAKVDNSTEWVEDPEGKLRELFKVTGYPTLFVLEKSGKISQVIAGVPEKLKENLLTTLSNPQRH
jgi:thiol-disulfide isomerase/thioredoxin